MDDMHRVFGTGYFSLCTPRAEETRDGIKLTLEVCSRAGGVGGGGRVRRVRLSRAFAEPC